MRLSAGPLTWNEYETSIPDSSFHSLRASLHLSRSCPIPRDKTGLAALVEDLAAIELHLLVDGLVSMRMSDRSVALRRMASCGAVLVTTSSVLFEMAGGNQKAACYAVLRELELGMS